MIKLRARESGFCTCGRLERSVGADESFKLIMYAVLPAVIGQ